MKTNLHTLMRGTAFLSLALLLGVALGACQSEGETEGASLEDVAEGDDPNETMADNLDVFDAREIYEDVNPYLGQTVTVSGEIEETYGTNAVMLGEDAWGEQLLVVIPADATISGMVDGAEVGAFGDLMTEYVLEVTGTVRQYVEAEIERDYDWTLDATLETEIEDQEPMIVAETVRVMTEEMVD